MRPTGLCELCHEHSEMQDSHFIPKALYRLLLCESRNPNSYLFSTNGVRQISRQATQYLLCANCETRFDHNGENWVMRHLYRGRGIFRLRSVLRQSNQVVNHEDTVIYSATSIPEIDIDKLVYFAASIFWRASVRNWQFWDQTHEALKLGIDQEALRAYLLGKSPFPSNAVVNVMLSHLESPDLAVMMPETLTEDGFDVHRFHIPGITFQLYLGKQLPKGCSDCCVLRSPIHPIYVAKHGDALVLISLLALAGKIKTPAPNDSVMDVYKKLLTD